MKKTARGGFSRVLGKLVASFFSFLTGPAVASAIFGFLPGLPLPRRTSSRPPCSEFPLKLSPTKASGIAPP
jgi:hypothetical protein